MRARSRGVSLIELMVAVTLALVTIIVVMQVLSVYEARKRTTTYTLNATFSPTNGPLASAKPSVVVKRRR